MSDVALGQVIAGEELEEFRRALRDFLAARSASVQVRRAIDEHESFDADLWRRLAGELGVPGLHVPERFGGSGFGVAELALAAEETGRALACVPLLASAGLAATALIASGDDAACARLLPGIAEGTTVAALAGIGTGVALDDDLPVGAEQDDGWRLRGTDAFVVDGHVADVVLVVAAAPRGPSLFAVDAAAPGLSREPMATLDLARRQAELRLDGAPATLVGDEGAAGPVAARARDVGLVLLAAEATGGAAAALDMTVAYVKERVQFGRPIGSFQAIKHRCADVLVAVESARSAVMHAAWTADHEPDALPGAASLAKAHCVDAYLQAAAACVQLHGGIGFTWEHDAHLHLRRARSAQALLGPAAAHRERLLQTLGA